MSKLSLRGYPTSMSQSPAFDETRLNTGAPRNQRPANDNFHFPKPANDNQPAKKAVRQWQRAMQSGNNRRAAAAAKKLAKLGFSNLPAVRVARGLKTLWDISQDIMGYGNASFEYNVPGMILTRKCNTLPINWQFPTSATNGLCISLQAGGEPLGTPINDRALYLSYRYPISGGFRWTAVEHWASPDGNPVATQAELVSQALPISTPFEWPNHWPDMTFPQTQWEPLPMTHREARKRPYGDTYQTHHREPRKRKEPRLKPYQVPSIISTVTIKDHGNGQTTVSTTNRPGVHDWLPPKRGEKERKFQGRVGAVHSFLATYGMAPTEWLDFLDALYGALPGEIRSQSRYHGNVINRFQAVYENFDQIDVLTAMSNIGYNIVEDRIIGRINRAIDKAGVESMGLEGWYFHKGKLTMSTKGL